MKTLCHPEVTIQLMFLEELPESKETHFPIQSFYESL